MNHDLEELTTHCIRCGFCIESCPTFLETGSELESPRGRIYLVRSALEGKLDWQEDVRPHLDLCLGCRNCETACPSGVQYGVILEMARDRIEQQRPVITKKALLAATTRPKLLRSQLAFGGLLPGKRLPGPLSRILSGEAPEVDRPKPQPLPALPPLDEATLPPIRGEVYLLEGCAMRVLFPRVHLMTRRLLRRIGYAVREVPQGCCGALHAHNGYVDEAKSMLSDLEKSMPDDLPVVVNSAGCGSTMKDSGTDLGRRTQDISEFFLANGLLDALAKAPGLPARVTYHDACHLRHGQRISSPPRQLIQGIPQSKYVELPEADLCCGSAGIYNVLQPKMARQLVERKVANIEATEATLVALGNPGCHAWIAQAAQEHGGKFLVLHTAEMLEAAFVGLSPFL